ncbi:uncharacterized protein LOC112184816 [Rosa chinensis]|uniref:uncharacterized protein LOC112184816 n=1 Tax=Rosa chinensis TaxID=74649 RepID=UPI000D08EB9D|nr:uncharacterized protein LOC112184816 [Rosa chinensis]
MDELIDVTITEPILAEKKLLMEKLQSLLSQEETFWKQLSKVTWLKEGDQNIGYFHRKAANRRKKNTLNGLFDETGECCEDDEGMERVITSYFSSMFTASDIDLEVMHTILEAIQTCVTQDMNERLCAEYSLDEHYWDAIGEDVAEAVLSFLQSERNCRVWDDKASSVNDVLIRTVSRLQDFRCHAMKSSRTGTRGVRVTRWVAPPIGWFKINVDGSFHHATKTGSGGFVIWNWQGTMLAGGGKPLVGLISPEHAEVEPCKQAVKFAVEQAFMPAMIETDSLLVQQ